MKFASAILIILLFPLIASATAKQLNFENICANPSGDVQYCEELGKTAVPIMPSEEVILEDLQTGIIVGVTWLDKGNKISVREANLAQGVPVEIIRSPKNAYYYIIDDGDGNIFVKDTSEVKAQ